MVLNVLDLFCGCGGLSKGLSDSGLKIVGAIDIWDKAVDNYNLNFTDHSAIVGDLTKLSPEEYNKTILKNKKIDILVGSPPCQSFSTAGDQDPDDPKAHLFLHFVKYLNYFKPKIFMMENVMGMLSTKAKTGGKVIDIIMSYLDIDYNTIICKLYASDFEVPQNRRRVIIIGVRKDLNIIPTEPIIVSVIRPAIKTILEKKNDIDKSLFLSQKAIDGINRRLIENKKNGKGFGAQFCDLNKPSYTIPAQYWKDGSAVLIKYTDTSIRKLSILELKRVQSFPDSYKILGSKKDVITQIGNAVAPRFAYHLGKHLINILQ